MPHRIRYDGAATADLKEIGGWVAAGADVSVAIDYIARIEAACEALRDFPNRGRARRRSPTVRSIGFERKASILYRVTREEVVILRVLHAGRDGDLHVAALR